MADDPSVALVAAPSQAPIAHGLAEIERMAVAIAKSGLFGVKRPEEAVALMLLAQAEGLHPVTAARDYHIIDGRPALKADAMLARFLAAGGKVTWQRLTDEGVTATFAHPVGGTVQIDWSLDRARRAGLGGRPMWAKYPRQMLRSRVISEGVRTVFPGVVSGIYTPDEDESETKPGTVQGGVDHLASQWREEAPVTTVTVEAVPATPVAAPVAAVTVEAGPATPAAAPVAAVTVEAGPATPAAADRPLTARQRVAARARELGVPFDEVTAKLFSLRWETQVAKLTPEQVEELLTVHLPALAAAGRPVR